MFAVTAHRAEIGRLFQQPPKVKALANAMAPGGILFIYGALAADATPFPLKTALGKALSMRGYTLFEVLGDETRFANGKRFVNHGLEAGDFKPIISRTFDFENMVEAHRYMESNQQFGKIVVTVGG